MQHSSEIDVPGGERTGGGNVVELKAARMYQR